MNKKHPNCKSIRQYISLLAIYNPMSAINFGGKIGRYAKKYNKKHAKFI